MSILSERLLIRSFTPDDAAALAAILGDSTTMRFWPQPFTRAEAAEWLGRNIAHRAASFYGRRAVVLRATGALIGDVGVVRANVAGLERDDLGYILHHPHWGRGYATEAARALLAHCFAIQRLPALWANMAWDHTASQRVAERLGMRRSAEFVNPRNRDIRTLLYTIERPG